MTHPATETASFWRPLLELPRPHLRDLVVSNLGAGAELLHNVPNLTMLDVTGPSPVERIAHDRLRTLRCRRLQSVLSPSDLTAFERRTGAGAHAALLVRTVVAAIAPIAAVGTRTDAASPTGRSKIDAAGTMGMRMPPRAMPIFFLEILSTPPRDSSPNVLPPDSAIHNRLHHLFRAEQVRFAGRRSPAANIHAGCRAALNDDDRAASRAFGERVVADSDSRDGRQRVVGCARLCRDRGGRENHRRCRNMNAHVHHLYFIFRPRQKCNARNICIYCCDSVCGACSSLNPSAGNPAPDPHQRSRAPIGELPDVDAPCSTHIKTLSSDESKVVDQAREGESPWRIRSVQEARLKPETPTGYVI